MKFNKIFSQNQVGFITEIVEPVHHSFNIDYVKNEFSKNPELSALPVETESGISGLIERDAVLKDQKKLDSILHKNIKNFVVSNTLFLKARENIEKALKDIFVSSKTQINNCMVYHNGDFCGIVNTRKLVAHILKLRNNELKKAREVQKKILGHNKMDTSLFKSEVVIEMAHEVGGDFFLMKNLGDHKYIISCMDVSGKDVSASLITGVVGGYFASLEYFTDLSSLSGTEIITALHNIIRSRTPEGYFLAGVVVVIDSDKAEIEIFNMGYSPLCMVYKNIGENRIVIKNPTLPPIGLPNFKITDDLVVREKIKKGFSIFGFSDGLTDAQNSHGIALGDKAVYEMLKQSLKKNDKDALNSVVKEVKNYIGTAPFADDITAFMVDFK